MKSLEFDTWDEGRLQVNREYAPLLRAQGLTTFASLMSREEAQIAKNLRTDRVTLRIELPCPEGVRDFYLKRHGPAPWRDYLKPLIRFRRPLLGARPEWEALVHFHAAGIPTMTPVAFGASGQHSCLLTAALDGCVKLSEWRDTPAATRQLAHRVGRLAANMHRAGLHHQDFYLGHLLVDRATDQLHVIDLGRARRCRRLSRHWIVKDLAQLAYSARTLPRSHCLRFLRAYLGRPLESRDRRLLQSVRRKMAAIARHSHKNRL